MAFISLKKGTTIQLYDSRGFDVLSADKEFLKMLFNKYKKDIVDFDDIEFNNWHKIKTALKRFLFYVQRDGQ